MVPKPDRQQHCPKCDAPMMWEQHRKGAKTNYYRWRCGRCRGLSATHKMTWDDFQRLSDQQGGGCAICGAVGELVVDHQHDACCGASKSCQECRRGLLCHTCNRMLGLGKDEPMVLLAAAMYLFAARRK